MRSRWGKLVIPVAVLAIVAGACGGDDDDTSSDETSAEETTVEATSVDTTSTEDTSADTTSVEDTSADDTSVETTAGDGGEAGGLGEPNAAAGEPVKIGLITEEGSEAIGGQSLATLHAFEMGVQYLNEYQAGLAGRPIELFSCGNSNTPAGAQDCAQQMVEQDVVAVVLPFDCCGDDQVPIVVGAGIPYIVASGSAPSHLSTPGAFAVTGGYVATLAGVARHAADQGFEKVTHVVIDVPSAVGAATDIGGLVFANAGVDYEVVAVAPGTPDMTPQLSTAGDSAVMVTGDLSFCTSFNQAYDTLGLSNPKYQIATCIDPSVLETVPSAYDGSFLPTGVSNEGEDAELYAVILAEYDDSDINPDPLLSGGTATPLAHLVNFRRFMEGLQGDVTAATVMEQMKSAKDVPLFMADGATATCDGTAIPILPNVCAAGILMATLGADGVPVDVAAVDLTGLFEQPG